MLTFSINHHPDFCATISLYIIDVVSAKGEFAHVRCDRVLRNRDPGIKF